MQPARAVNVSPRLIKSGRLHKLVLIVRAVCRISENVDQPGPTIDVGIRNRQVSVYQGFATLNYIGKRSGPDKIVGMNKMSVY